MKIYNIGDKVWYAQRKAIERQELCPDCFGTRALTVIKGDGEQVSIECAGCARGFESPTGYISWHGHVIDVAEVVIEKVEQTALEIKYGFRGCYHADADCMCDTKEEAEAQALKLAEKHNKEELERIYRKHKHDRTWAWNAHYHRDCIKRAERDLEYHKAKLAVAKVKAKELNVAVEPKLV